jgi:hypothetical protein
MNRKVINLRGLKTAGKGKRLAVLAVDYFTLVIFSFAFLILAVLPISNATPGMTQLTESCVLKQQEVTDLIVSTRLQDYDSANERLVSVSDSAPDYLKKLMLTTFYRNGEDYFTLGANGTKVKTIIDIKDTLDYSTADEAYANDRIRGYYLGFRKTNLASYSSPLADLDLAKLNRDYWLLGTTNQDLVPSDFNSATDSFVLSKDNGALLMAYLNFSDTGGQALNDRLTTLFESVVSQGVSEVETYYTPYLSAFADFTSLYHQYVVVYDLCLVLSFVLGFLVVYLLFPLCFGYDRTLGERFFSLVRTSPDEEKVTLPHVLLRDLILFFESLSSLFFLPLFLGKLTILSLPFIGSITLFQIVVFSFLLDCLSVLFFLFNKSSQTLGDLAGTMTEADRNEHEEGVVYGRTNDPR